MNDKAQGLTAGARLLEAAREVTRQFADFERMTDEAAAAMRALRAATQQLPITSKEVEAFAKDAYSIFRVGVDLASGPDRQVTAYVGSDFDDVTRARYELVKAESDADRLVIRDVGPWEDHPTVTNDAVRVVSELAANLVGGRRLFYYDTDGRLDEILITDGRFAGFTPGPGDASEPSGG